MERCRVPGAKAQVLMGVMKGRVRPCKTMYRVSMEISFIIHQSERGNHDRTQATCRVFSGTNLPLLFVKRSCTNFISLLQAIRRM